MTLNCITKDNQLLRSNPLSDTELDSEINKFVMDHTV